MKQPSTSTFWRFLLATISFFALWAYWSLIGTAQRLNILVFHSEPWMLLFGLLSVFTLSIISLLVISYSRMGRRLFEFLESIVETRFRKLSGGLFLILGLTGFAVFTSDPYFIRVLG